MWNLWHTLVSHLALGTIHLYLNIPVLSIAYRNMFGSLGIQHAVVSLECEYKHPQLNE